jgi:hypothetical protein
VSNKIIRKILLYLCVLSAGLYVWLLFDNPEEFVMITIEESSTSVLKAYPMTSERIPGVFLDEATKTVLFEDNPNLSKVSLVLHYTAVSQGIEYHDQLILSCKDKAKLKMSGPLSLLVEGPGGEKVEAIDNRSRVVSGDLEATICDPDGSVQIRYGSHEFTLAPGQSWAQLLALTPGGTVEILPEDWESCFDLHVENGYPITRVAIANRGLWPKNGREQEWRE